MSPRVAFVAEGDANTADCWSGCGRGFVQALRGAGVEVDVYDAALRSWSRAAAAVLSYHPSRARWRQRYGLGSIPFAARSARVSRALAKRGAKYDAIVQAGATFVIGGASRRDTPYIIYCDSNVAYSRRGAPYSAASRLSSREFRSALEREQRIYDDAHRIWVFSDALAQSFRTDFAQPAEKIVTIYAGMNNPANPVPAARKLPRILFVGKDHERKGSRVLLEAFDHVRSSIPDAELHMVGRASADFDRPGVVAHGVLSRGNSAGRTLLDELFATASIFCMPSRYEPFGVVFAEAMNAGLACVGTTGWAMPEIIEDGKTGWLVPDGAVDELATVLVAALRDPALCSRMGSLGRARALARFTWDRTATRALADLETILGAGVARTSTTLAV